MKTRKSTLLSIPVLLFIASSFICSAQEKVEEEDKKVISLGRAIPATRTFEEPFYHEAIPFGSTGIWSLSEGKSTRLILTKKFDGESITKESKFEVEDEQKRLKIVIKGICESGRILVTVRRPSNQEYKSVIIDSSAEVEWSQSVRFTDEESDYVGNWIVQIVAEEANGYYTFTISAD
ncbi:MAG: hypothetical protein JSV24_03290 [Bacteroidales bacterium]|nr:MAG: hypothetical protein JSV24_03290 [Bacteroidales bacterium]